MTTNPLKEAQAEVEAALSLLDSEAADALVGEPQPEAHGVLVKGVKGAYQMLWAMARTNGLKQTPEVQKMGAQALLILTTLVHYAYALGVRHGRGEE